MSPQAHPLVPTPLLQLALTQPTAVPPRAPLLRAPAPAAFDWLVKRVRRHTAVVQHALSVGDHRLLAQAVLPSLVMLLVIAGFVFAATRKTKED